MAEKELKLSFYGGTGIVTGSNFLVEDGETKLLIDCGLIQGRYEGEDPNLEPFKYNPAEIDFLFVTHAHIDHIGRVGKLMKEGFRGRIYSTPPTKELAVFMLEDALNVMKYHSKEHGGEMMYEKEHVDLALSNWGTIPYHQKETLGSFDIYLKDAGHILGSAIAEVTHKDSGKKVIFTGDLGNSPTPLLRDTEKIDDADYLVVESVYGDRVHEEREERKEKLREVIKKVVGRNGTLIVPVFSLEKTQVFLKEINDLIEDGKVPSVPVFFDSPLGIKLTSVYSQFTNYFNDDVQKEIAAGDDIFDFPKLKVTMRRDESEAIDRHVGAKIIIASSGMSEGGRITAHEKKFLPDVNNALLLIGYQVAGSAGRRIQEGAKRVKLGDSYVNVKAEIITVSGYSSHRDSNGLFEFIEGTAETVKKVFVVMGEPKASLYFVQRLRDNMEVDAVMPELGETVVLG